MVEIIQLKGKYEYKNKNKGYDRTYHFYAGDGTPITTCDVYGECIKEPTVYQGSADSDTTFKMLAKGKILNATYYVQDNKGAKLATITRKGFGFRWKILGKNDLEVARVIDPASNTEAFFRELFAARPDSYAIVSNELLIATIGNEKRLDPLRQEPKNMLGKIIQKVIPDTGLTLRFEAAQSTKIDRRIIIAAMTLLQVHDITGVNRY